MIRNCILFRVVGDAGLLRFSEPKVQGLTLAQAAKTATRKEAKRLEGLRESCRDERLSSGSSSEGFLAFKFTARQRVRRLTASGDVQMPFVPVEFRAWAEPAGGWILTFDAGRRASAVATALLSSAAGGTSDTIRPAKLDKDSFERIRKWAAGRSAEGSISRVTFQGVKSGKTLFRQVVLRATNLESSSVFEDFFSGAGSIANMTFFTPKLEASGRSICLKVSSWGGLTLYSPDVLDSELLEVVGRMVESGIG